MSANTVSALQLQNEQFGKAVEVASDFWVIASNHRPAGSKYNPEINNRCLVFRLKDASAGNNWVLLVANAVDVSVLPELLLLEKQTKTPLRYLISPGAGHSLNLVEWHDALPHVKVLVGPVRIPRIAAGKKLASSPRFVVFDQSDPLPMFHGQLEAVNFDGIGGFKETVTPKEGGKDSKLGFLKVMFSNMPPKDPHDELWLFHVASRTAIGGENLGWHLSKHDHAAMPLMFRMMMKAEQAYLMAMPRPVLDKAKVTANWKKILDWPAENVLSYHDSLGTGILGNGQAQLRAAVEKVKQLAA